MTKTFTAPLTKFNLGLFLVLILLAQSCKKEIYTDTNQNAITAAQELLKTQTNNQPLTTALFRKTELNELATTKTSANTTIPINADIKLNADWDNAKTYEQKDKTIVEVPLLYNGIFMFNLGAVNKDEALNKNKSITRLLFFITKEKTEGYFMTIISSNEYLKLAGVKPQNNTYLKQEPNFTGAIIYHDLNGIYNAGKRFNQQENVLNKLSATKNQNPGKISIIVPPGCYEEDLWQVFGEGCYEVPEGIHCAYMYSEYVGTYLVCPNGSNTNPGSGGGSGGTSNPTSDIRNQTTDPCINKTIKEALATNKDIEGKLAEIIKKFDVSKNVTIKVFDGITSNNLPGQTTNQQFIGSNFSAKITLSTDYHANTSKENIIATLIHEFVHAYLTYTGNTTLQTNNHTVIAEKYITPMATYLKSSFGIDLKDAYALAWSGVPNSKAWSEASDDFEFEMSDGNKITKAETRNLSGPYKLSTNILENVGFTKGTKICD